MSSGAMMSQRSERGPDHHSPAPDRAPGVNPPSFDGGDSGRDVAPWRRGEKRPLQRRSTDKDAPPGDAPPAELAPEAPIAEEPADKESAPEKEAAPEQDTQGKEDAADVGNPPLRRANAIKFPMLDGKWRAPLAWLGNMAVLDNKQDLINWFNGLPPEAQNMAMHEFEKVGVFPEEALTDANWTGTWRGFKSIFTSEHTDWTAFGDLGRAAQNHHEKMVINETTPADYAEYSRLGLATGATAAKSIANMAGGISAEQLKQAGNLTDGVKASHGLGVGAGALGVVGDFVAAGKNVADIAGDNVAGGEKLAKGMDLGANIASAQSNTTNAVDQAGRLATNNAGVMSSGALGTALGVGAIVGGAATMGKGAAQTYAGHKGAQTMEGIATQDGGDEMLKSLAGDLKGDQELKRTEGISNIAKGAVMITGGALLIALGLSNPVGPIILGIAGAIGGIMAAYKWWKGKKKKKETVDKYFAADLEKVKRSHPRLDSDEARDKVLQQHGFNSADSYYEYYQETYGEYLFGMLEQGVANPGLRAEKEMLDAKAMVETLGLNVDWEKPHIPSKKDIAKKI